MRAGSHYAQSAHRREAEPAGRSGCLQVTPAADVFEGVLDIPPPILSRAWIELVLPFRLILVVLLR